MIKTKNNFAMKVVAMVLAITMIIGTIPSSIATVFANESDAVAKIGDKEYASLEAALADVPVGNSKETPAEATVIELCQDTAHSFDVGISNGTKPKNIELQLNDNTLTLKPAVGSTGTVSNGIRVLAYSKLTITNGNIVCSSEEDDNVKVGIANYGEMILDGVKVQSGALTRYTINNRGELTLKGDTVIQNGQVAPNDYSDSTGLVAITNDPYDLYYSTPVNATINCDSENVVVGNIQIERYEIAKNHEKGNNVLNISEGSFGSIVIPAEASDTGIDVVGNITGGSFEAASGVELQNVMDLTVAGIAYQTPEKAVSIKLTDNLENGFDVGASNGTAPKYFKLDLNQKTITLRPAVGSVGTVSSGIRVLAYSKLEIKNGDVVCSDATEDNVKAGIANYGTLVLDSVDVKAGALTKYTINNRGELTLSGTSTVENAKVAHGDYSTGSTYVAITNDPYTLYYTNDAVINCDSKDVVVGNVQLETYSSAGNVKLNISEGSFGEVVAPTVSENDKVEILGNITGGKYASDVSDYVASDYNVSFDNDTYTVAQKLEQDNFGFETPLPLDQWVGETYTNKVTGVQGTGTTTYSVVAGEDVATVNASTGEVTFLKLGTVTIQADNTGDSEYLGASAKYSVTSVKKGQEAFKFATTGPVEVDWELNGTYQNTVTGGSGDGEVSYKILENNGVATIDSETGVVTFIKAGEITVQATKASDDKYFSIDTTYILKISKVEQDELKAEADSIITYSPEWQDVIEVSGGSGNGNYKFELPNDYSEYAEINPNTGAIKTKRYGTIKVLVSKEGDDCYNATKNYEVVIEIKRAEQSNFKFAVEAPNSITYGENNNSFTNLASGGQTTNNPTYAITGDAATVDAVTGELTIVKAGTVTITATKLGDDCYDAIEATYTLEIKHARQSFAFEEGQEVSETYGIHEFVNEIIDEVGTGAITFEIVSGDDIGATIDENTGVITFEDSELKVGEISVLATKAGNECYEAFELGYTLEISYLTVGNDVRPTLSGDTKNSSGWYTGDVTFAAPADYRISMANTLDASNVWGASVTYGTEGVNDVNLYLMNAEGYITDAITFEDVKIDKKSPEKLEVKYSASIKDVILETITFGIFEAKTVDVTITVADSTSGIDTLTYDYGDGVASVLAEDLTVDGTYKFTIDKDLRHKVEVEVSDIAGNTTVYDDNTTYVLDLTKPGFEVTYEYDSGSANIDNDIIYTQGKTTFKFKITEENYDLAKKEGVVPVVKYDNVPTSLEWTFDETTKVVTASLPVSASGDHVVTVEYTDLSDNQMDTYSKEIHIDSTVPVIDVSYNNNEVRNDIHYKADRTATVKITEHNFKADEVVLTVAAEDINGNPVDISEKAYADYAKNPANWNTVGDVHTLKTDGMTFDIEAIYSVKLEYTDLAGNVEVYETEFVVDKTAVSEENIQIEYSTAVYSEVIEKLTFGFYKAPVTITVTAEDETAGVEYFELTYTKETGASDVNTDTYKTEKLTAVQDAEDKSVFTATHTIPAQARGSVSVDVMDRAGNDSAKADTNKVVVVDDITPVLDVQYTFTDGQYREYNDIYYTKGETKVTFTIDEANFDVASKPVVTVNEENREVTWNQTTGTDKWVGEITLTGNDDYAIKVTFADKSGNVMDTYEKTVHIDNVAPKFDVTYDNNEARNENNYKADRIATVKITEHNFKADEVVLTVAAEDINGNPVDISEKAYADYVKNPANWNAVGDVHTLKTDGVKFDIEAIYSVKLEYTDLAENVAEVYETEFVVDKTDAGNIKIEYSTSVLDEIIEGITFGFYKAPVTITVTAEDETAGVEYFELTYTKETGASDVNTDTYKTEKLTAVQDAEDKSVFTATHTIPAQARGSVSVDVMDRAGNDSAKADTNKVVVVDDITPVLDVQYTFTDGQYREYNDIYYTQGETKVTFTIDEANFDVASKPVVTVNEENREVTWNQTTGTDKWVGEITLTGNDDYAVKVTFADKSGNVMDTYEKIVHIDDEAPVIDVTYDNNEARNDNNYKADKTATVKITEHNFKADEVVLTVTAEDINGNPVDISAKAYADYAKNPANWNTVGDVHTLKTDGVKFDIEAIYSVKLEYTDLAENEAEAYETEFVVDKTDAGNIKIEYSTSILDEIIEGITFGFYKAPVTITVTAEDETAGVEYFELTYTKEAGASNVNTDTYKTEKLTAVQDAEDKSVFTATHTIPAQARGSVSVDVMDRAGNDSVKADTKMLVVDDISPTRKVEYANAIVLDRATMTPVDSYEEDDVVVLYYETEAEVTITIDEANFYKEDVKVSVTKNGVENEQDVSWTDESVDVHVGKFTLSGDGDYFVKVSYTDRSGNTMKDYAANEYTSQEIRIDNTDPTTSVGYYSDAEPVNVKYYKADRKAVITIVDHNFLADDVVATVTAKNVQNRDIADAEEIAKGFADYLRNRDSWTHSGDVHTAEITFTEDAQYTFKIDYKDIVGNSAVTYEAEPFVVDHKAPTDAITVEYKTPIIEKVISAITFGFYNPSVTVVITADDITSGVDYFEWTYNQEADTSTEKNIATESGKIGTGDISYSNEGKTATTNFALSADEAKQYRGNITFTATDRAGNTCAEYQDTDDISIVDTISPTINVTYTAKETDTKVHYVDKNLDDINTVEEFKTNGYQAYYDGNVVATIQINEANFFEGIKTDDNKVIHEVGILLVKTYDDGSEQKVEFLPEGSVQKYAGASVHGIEWKKDGDTYSYDIPYDEEADYELTVEYVDFSNNNASVSADDSNSFEDIKIYTSKIITVDKTAPIVAVTYGNKNIKNTVGGRQYFDAKQTATITVEEHNFRADDFNATVVAKDVCEEDVTVEDFAKTLATRENWRKNGNTYTIEIEYPVDANYTFDYEYEDLAQNSAEEYKQDIFTVDTTAPKNLKVVYSTSVLEKILESITFGYYNAEMTVTISAEDETAGIHYFVYSYIKDSGVSDVNAELLNEVIKNANENIKQNGKVFTTEFKIPKLALGNDNQFNGTVKFTAYDRAENNTEKVDNHRIVVDNIKPTIAVTYNKPVQTVNNISYYAGNIEGTIVINEANFYSEDVKIVVTKDGSQTAVNVKWVDNSVDVHTGTFTLTEDGDYIISVEYKDRSSNAMDTYTSNRLTLDTKAPTVNVTNIKNNSANKDEKYSFVITANDTNLNAESFKPVLTAVVRGEDGSYSTRTISLGDMTTVEAGKTYSYTINNLEEDAVYSLVCSLKDMSENAYSKIVLSDGKEYEEVRFSINRNGSTFAINENTEKLVNQYYVYSVDEDVVIEEVNVDPIENYVVKLNGKTLTEGTDYKTSLSDRAEEWSKRTYTISKSLFEEEGEYSIVVESTDKAETTAYSDVKNLNVSFVVDQTKPVVTISGLETSGRYQVEEQIVTIMPTDDGGRLNSVKVILMDSDGKELSILFEMSGEELLNYLAENDGKITFIVPEGLENKIQIICNDCAVNAAGDTNEYNEIFERVTVSQSTWVIYYANKPLFYGTIAGALALIAGIIILIVLKKRKKEENN